jgi:uncharacterized Rossmann fold enzyme
MSDNGRRARMLAMSLLASSVMMSGMDLDFSDRCRKKKKEKVEPKKNKPTKAKNIITMDVSVDSVVL